MNRKHLKNFVGVRSTSEICRNQSLPSKYFNKVYSEICQSFKHNTPSTKINLILQNYSNREIIFYFD